MYRRTAALRFEAVAEFEAHPWWRDAVRLRRWDDLANDPAANVPGFETHLDEVRTQAAAVQGGAG